MGFFNKNDENDTPRNPDSVFLFRALAAGYALYMEYKIVQTYLAGEATLGMWFLIVSLLGLGGGALYVLISSFISWRKEKAELAAQELLELEAVSEADEEEETVTQKNEEE